MQFNFNFEAFEQSGKEKNEAINYLKSLNSSIDFDKLEQENKGDENAIYEALKGGNFSFSKPSIEQTRQKLLKNKENEALKAEFNAGLSWLGEEKKQNFNFYDFKKAKEKANSKQGLIQADLKAKEKELKRKEALFETRLKERGIIAKSFDDMLDQSGAYLGADLLEKGLNKLGFKDENYIFESEKEDIKSRALKSVREKLERGDLEFNEREKHALRSKYDELDYKKALEKEKERLRLSQKSGNFNEAEREFIENDLGFFNTLFNDDKENIKEFKEKVKSEGVISSEIIKAANTLKAFDEGNLFKNMLFADEKEKKEFQQNFLNDAYKIAELSGFDDVGLDKKGELYFIKDEQKYLVNTGFFDNFAQLLNDTKFEFAGGVLGGLKGFNSGKSAKGKVAKSILGAAAGSFGGAFLDAKIADMYLNRESDFKKNLDFAIQAGLLSMAGDGVILSVKPLAKGLYKGVKKGGEILGEYSVLGGLKTLPTQNIQAAEKIIDEVFSPKMKEELKAAQEEFGGSVRGEDLKNAFFANLQKKFTQKYGENDSKTKSVAKIAEIFNTNSLKTRQQAMLDLVRSDKDGSTLAYLLEIAKDDVKIQSNLKNMLNLASSNVEKNLKNLNINAREIKHILDEFEAGNKAAFKEVESQIARLYDENYRVVLSKGEYENIKEEFRQNGVNLEEMTPFLRDLEANVFNENGVTFTQLNNFRKNLNFYIYNRDKTPNFINTLKKIGENILKNEIDKGIDNIFSQNKAAYESIKELYSTSLKDYATLKSLNESIKNLKLQDSAKSADEVLNSLIKYAKGQGENGVNNLQKIKDYLGEENNAFLEMQILNKLFKESVVENDRASLRVFDSEGFLSRVRELVGDTPAPLGANLEARALSGASQGPSKQENFIKKALNKDEAKLFLENLNGAKIPKKLDIEGFLKELESVENKENFISHLSKKEDAQSRLAYLNLVEPTLKEADLILRNGKRQDYIKKFNDGKDFFTLLITEENGKRLITFLPKTREDFIKNKIDNASLIQSFTSRASKQGNGLANESITQPLFKSKEAREFLELVEGFHKLYKNDASIAKNLVQGTASQLSTSIATSAEGAIKQKVVKGGFDPIFRLLPDKILFGLFAKQIQGGALRYHLKKALSRSLNYDDFKIKLEKELKRTNFNSNTSRLIDEFMQNLEDFNREKEQFLKAKREEQARIKEEEQARINAIKTAQENAYNAQEANLGKDILESSSLKEDFGENFAGYKGKEAIEKLLEEQRGQVKGAFYKEGLGEIDLVWGEVKGGGKEAKGYGLSKIIEKHGEDFKEFGEGLEGVSKGLDEIITKGEIHTQEYGRKTIIYHKNGDVYKVGLKQNWKGEPTKNSWVITGYKEDREADKFIHSSDFTKGEALPLNSNESIAQKAKKAEFESFKDKIKELYTKYEGLNHYDKSESQLKSKLLNEEIKPEIKKEFKSIIDKFKGADNKDKMLRVIKENKEELSDYLAFHIALRKDIYIDGYGVDKVDFYDKSIRDFIKFRENKRWSEIDKSKYRALAALENLSNKNTSLYFSFRDLNGKIGEIKTYPRIQDLLFYDLPLGYDLKNAVILSTKDKHLKEKLIEKLKAYIDKKIYADFLEYKIKDLESRNPKNSHFENYKDEKWDEEALKSLQKELEDLRVNEKAQKLEAKESEDIIFTDKKGKEHTLTKETQKAWLEAFNLKSLEEAYIPNFKAEVKEAINRVLGGEEIKLTKGSFEKLLKRDREEFLPYIKDTLEKANAVIKQVDGALIFAKDYRNERLGKFFASVSRNDEGEWIITSNAPKNLNNLKNKLNEGGELLYSDLPELTIIAKPDLDANALNSEANLKDIIAQKPQQKALNLQEIEQALKARKSQINDEISANDKAFKENLKEVSKVKPILEALKKEWEALEPTIVTWTHTDYSKAKPKKYYKRKPNLSNLWHIEETLDVYKGYARESDRHANQVAREIALLEKYVKSLKDKEAEVKAFKAKAEADENALILESRIISIYNQLREAFKKGHHTTKQMLEANNIKQDSELAKEVIDSIAQTRQYLEDTFNITPLKEFGTNYAEFYKDGKGAVEKLLAEKQGQVAGAFYKEGLGEIDLVWGDSKKGLSHILERRTQDFINQGLEKGKAEYKVRELLSEIPQILENGKILSQNNDKIELITDKYTLVLGLREDKKFIVTELIDKRNKKRLEAMQTGVGDSFTDEPLAKTPLSQNQQEIIPQQKIKFAMEKFNYDEKKAKDLLEWHKNSHALTKDENGLPKVFYHGTYSKFRVFRRVGKASQQGFFFTPSQKATEEYGDITLNTFLNIKNPFRADELKINKEADLQKWADILKLDYDKEKYESFKDLKTKLEKVKEATKKAGFKFHSASGGSVYVIDNKGRNSFINLEELDKENKRVVEAFKGLETEDIYFYYVVRNEFDLVLYALNKNDRYFHTSGRDEVKRVLEKLGYDGAVLNDTIITVFNSNQIKHIDNKGSFTDTKGNVTSKKPKDKEVEFSYFNEKSDNIYHSNPHLGAGLVGGTLNGVEQDENGNLSFDPAKFAMGFLGGSVGSFALKKGFQILEKNPELKEKIINELADTLAQGFEKAREKYSLLNLLEPRYIVKNEKGRKIQAKTMLKELEREQKGLYNVAFNGKNAVLIKKDLEAVDEAILFEKGTKRKGGKHIRLAHSTEPSQEGYVTKQEVANLGVNIREYLKNYEPFIDKNGARLYEWKDENGVKFRAVVNNTQTSGGNSHLPSASEEIITFYSDRNLKEKMNFKNPLLKDTIAESTMQGEALSKELESKEANTHTLREQTKELLSALVGKNITNQNDGRIASISRKNIMKMTSDKAIQKSVNNGFTPQDHFKAVQDIESLYQGAVLKETHADRKSNNPNVFIHRYTADFNGNNALITIKESLDSNSKGNKIYTLELETLELKPSAPEPQGSATMSKNTGYAEPVTPNETHKSIIAEKKAKFAMQKLNEKSDNIYHSNPHLGAGLVGGTLNGVEQDENGNLSFDPAKFAMGFLGGSVGSFALKKGFQILEKNPELKEKIINELADTLAQGFEKAREKYSLLNLLEPRYIVKNEKGRKIQAKTMLKELEREQNKNLQNIIRQNLQNLPLNNKPLELSEKQVKLLINRFANARNLKEHLNTRADNRKELYALLNDTLENPQIHFIKEGRDKYVKRYKGDVNEPYFYLLITQDKDKIFITHLKTRDIKYLSRQISNAEQIKKGADIIEALSQRAGDDKASASKKDYSK